MGYHKPKQLSHFHAVEVLPGAKKVNRFRTVETGIPVAPKTGILALKWGMPPGDIP